MGFIGSMLNPSSGSGFVAAGADPTQQNTAYQQTQQGLQRQLDFVNALNGQGGLGNQANVFNQQQALANQLQGVASGTGPNPAMNQLNQATGQNVANQASLMAGQRGSGANAGLMARLAAMQGANTQQQAVGQGATMAAQQQLAGMQMLGNQQSNMGSLANAQIGQQQTGLNAYNNAALQQQSNLLGIQSNANNSNANIAGGNQAAQGNMFGGLLGGAAMGMMALNKGGKVPGYADGGAIAADPLLQPIGNTQITNPQVTNTPSPMPMSQLGKSLAESASGGQNTLSKGSNMMGNVLGMGLGRLMGMGGTGAGGGAFNGTLMAGGAGDAIGGIGGLFESGGALAGAGEGIAEAAPLVLAANQGGKIGDKLKSGGEVPGKAKVPGDSPANDTVEAQLSPDEIVIPRSITMHPNAPELAKQFVAQTLTKGRSGKSNFDDGGRSGYMAPQEFDQFGRPMGQPVNPETMRVISDQKPAINKLLSEPLQSYDRLGRPIATQAPVQPQAPQITPDEQNPGGPNVDLGGGNTFGQQQGNSASDIYDKYNPTQGYDTAISGLRGEAKLQGQLSDQQAGIYNQQNNVLRDLTMEAQQNAWNHNIEVENVINDMKNDKIDPDRYINNKSTGQKIASAIGLILGGIGGGLTHQENPAMKYLNDSINRDIEAQKMEMGKKQNLLSALERQYGDKQDAVKMAHAIYSAKIENQIKEEAAKLGSPLAQERAKQAIGPLQNARQQALLEVGLKQAAMKGMQSGDPNQTLQAMRMVNPQMAKEMETRYVPGVGFASIPVTESARDKMIAGSDLDAKLSKLESFAKKYAGSFDPSIVNQGKALAGEVSNAYRVATHSGVYKESDQQFINSMIDPNPTKFMASLRTLPGYKAVRDSNRTNLKLLYKAHGLNPPPMPNFNVR